MTTGAILILLTQIVTLLAAGLGFLASRRNKEAIHEVHVSINSRMDELLRMTAAASRAEGAKQEKENPTP